MVCKNNKTSRISLLFAVILVLAVLPAKVDGQRAGNEKSDHPNVILILADDMGIGDISAFNDGLSKTPNIDSLIDQSVYFNQAYSGSPVCAPSRAAMLTGRYPHRTGSVTLNQRNYPDLTRLNKEETTIADIYSGSGYITGIIGKWHSGLGEDYHPLKRGFKEYAGFNIAPDINSYFEYKLDIQGAYHSFSDKYLTEHLTQLAIDFVQRHKEEPFFLHLAHYAPHRPLSAPEELVQQYLDQGLDKKTATIYAMIEVMDTGIGKLKTELEKLGIDDETIFIFSSDNGPDPIPGERFNMNMKGTKYTVYEGGINVPFLVHWPGTLEPGEREDIISFTDLLPTLAELCNLEVSVDLKKTWDGRSFANILFDNSAENRLPGYRFWQWNRGVPYYSHNSVMREGEWKLVRPHVTNAVPENESTQEPKLFNLEEDPSEKNDLSEEYPRRYERMRVLLRQWSREMEFSRLENYK